MIHAMIPLRVTRKISHAVSFVEARKLGLIIRSDIAIQQKKIYRIEISDHRIIHEYKPTTRSQFYLPILRNSL